MCHMCKCHVIACLFVYSLPSWGPHTGCRQTQFMASYLLLRCVYSLVGQFVCRVDAIKRRKKKKGKKLRDLIDVTLLHSVLCSTRWHKEQCMTHVATCLIFENVLMVI